MIAIALQCATVLVVAALAHNSFTRWLKHHARKEVLEALATHEQAFKTFAIETRDALKAQEKRLDTLKAPQNHTAAAQIAGGFGRVAR